jgi:hypothetical protein
MILSPDTPRAYPYGIYDLNTNTGFVNVGTNHDTSRFAVASIRAWWKAEGKAAYPQAEYLLLLADGEDLTVPREGNGNTSCIAYRKR